MNKSIEGPFGVWTVYRNKKPVGYVRGVIGSARQARGHKKMKHYQGFVWVNPDNDYRPLDDWHDDVIYAGYGKNCRAVIDHVFDKCESLRNNALSEREHAKQELEEQKRYEQSPEYEEACREQMIEEMEWEQRQAAVNGKVVHDD